MKKILFFAAFILAFGAIKAQDLVNWTIATSAVTAVQETTVVNEGTYSAKVTWTSTSNQDIYSDKFAVVSGSSFTYSLDVYDNDPYGKIRLAVAYNNGVSTYYSGIYSQDTDRYKTYTITNTVPSGADSAQIKLRFYDTNGFTPGQATVWVDNAIFTQGGPNLVPDGGFENWTGSTPTTDNHLTDAAYYDFTPFGGTEGLIPMFQSNVDTIHPTAFVLLPQNITFGFGTFLDADSSHFALMVPSATINNDNQLDTLVYNSGSFIDSAVFYAGILPINYMNTNDPDVIQNDYFVTIKGVVTASNNYNKFWVSDDNTAGHGVLIYDNSQAAIDSVSVGDSIMLIGKRTTYSGATEIIPLHADSINTGTITPQVISASEINTSLGQDDVSAEPWEGQLVTIDSMTVVSYNSSYYEYRLANTNGDTVIIDDGVDYHYGSGISLQTDSMYTITGVVTYAYGHYKLNPRDTNDAVLLHSTTPSTASIVYAVGLPQNSIALVYNQDITPDVSQIVLHQGNGLGDIQFSNYNQEDSGIYILYGADGTIANDNYVDTVVDMANATSAEFYAGVLPIAYTNKVNADTIDQSHFATFTGVVTANDNYKGIWIQNGAEAYNGVKIYKDNNADDSLFTFAVGDSLYVYGVRGEYNDMTELLNGQLIPLLDESETHNHTVTTTEIPAADIDMNLAANDLNAEPWEGQLVTIDSMTVVSMDSAYYEYTLANANGDSIIINDEIDYHYGSGISLETDSMYNITGIVTFNYGQYKINPRDTNDVVLVPAPTPVTNIEGNNAMVKVYPNPANDYVRISGDVENVEIYNVYGQRINTKFSNGTLNISGLPTGVYSLRITLENGNVQNSQIIKK